MMLPPEQMHVLVTGGAKRIGRVIVRAFASAGARVCIHCRDSEEEALALLTELGGNAKGHSVTKFDLNEPERIGAWMKQLPADLNILVNSAGLFHRHTLETETPAEAAEQFNVNFFAPVELMKQFVRTHPAGELAVINVTDCMTVQNAADSFSYLLSKKALAEATKTAALQLAPRVRVNAVAPGPMIPPPGMEGISCMEKTLPRMPLGRAVDPEDLARAVLFLASCRSATGTILTLDCGFSLH